MEILSHTLNISFNDNRENIHLSIQEAEELYNLLHRELKKDYGVVLNTPTYRDMRMQEPIYNFQQPWTSQTIDCNMSK